MRSFFFIKYLFNSLLFFFFKKKNDLDSYFKFNNDYNNVMVKLFFVCRIIPSIFFHYYNKIAYVFSHVIFAFVTIFKFLKPIILYVLKYLSIFIKIVILLLVYFTPILYSHLKNNFLIFTKNIKIRKLFFINNLYNSFSSKILLSGTAFFSIYILIFVFLLVIIIPFFFIKQQGLTVGGLNTLDSDLLGKVYFNVKTSNTLNFSFLENVIFEKNIKIFNILSLTQIHFCFCLVLSLFLFIGLNIIHSFLSFLSLCYDYLLKKLNSENFFVLFIISSTTLQIFYKLLSLILFI